MTNKTLRAIAVLIGTTIGAGIFGIPYVVTQIGTLAGIIYILGLGLVVLTLNLIYGEVILRTPGDHQLTGYGEIYFGKTGKLLATTALFVGIYGALLAYLIKIGEFLSLLTGYSSPLLFSLLFFILASIVLSFGLKTISWLELFLVGLMLLFVGFLFLVGLPHLHLANYNFSSVNLANILVPYGVILFALTGYSAIPEMEEVLRSQPEKLKKSILIGTTIPIFVYLLFALVIVGISGNRTSSDAISGLVRTLPNWITKLGAGIGTLTMSTSFLALGYVLREVWHRDFKLPKAAAFCLALFPALFLFLTINKGFIEVLEFSGAITGGLSGLLIALCFLKARNQGQRKPSYVLNIPKIVFYLVLATLILGMFTPFF